MKKNYLILSLLIICGCIIYSCKKMSQGNENFIPLETETAALINSFEKTFNEKGYQNKLIVPLNDTLSLKRIPNWKTYTKKNIGDTLDYYYFELNSNTYNPKTGKQGRGSESINTKKYLLVGKSKSTVFFRIATYFFNEEYLKENKAASSINNNYLKNFTGTVQFRNLDLNNFNTVVYQNGHMIDDGAKSYKENLSTTNNKHNAEFRFECVTKYDCYYLVYCDYWPRVLEVINVLSCPAQYPFSTDFVCGSQKMTTAPQTSTSYSYLECVNVWYPDPGTPPVTPPVTPPQISCTNCNGFGYKCINGVCELGTKEYTNSVRDGSSGDWICYYHFLFSDNSTLESSAYVESSSSPCN